MDILTLFTNKKEEFDIFEISHENIKHLLTFLPGKCRACYVTDKKLAENIIGLGKDAEEIIKETYLPDIPSLMSGEFGELLSYNLLQSIYKSENLIGVDKWVWKEDPNKSALKHDLILIKYDSPNPSIDDSVVLGEVKTKATSSKFNPIEKAIEDISKNHNTKLFKTLYWVKKKYSADSNKKMVDSINRFLTVEMPSYKKQFKAIAVIDDSLLQDEIGKAYSLPNLENFELIVISINNLKNTYNEFFLLIPKTYGSS